MTTRPSLVRITFLTLVWSLLFAPGARAQLTCSTLLCERLDTPLAVQEAAPRLSWLVQSPARGQRQTAYRVLVASSPEMLGVGVGDLWDSGRVESDRTAHVVYGGAPLRARQVCHWKVMSWDGGGVAGPWSVPGRFEMGLLDGHQWSAKWIDAGPRRVAVEVVRATYYTPGGSVRTDVTAAVAALVAAGRHVVASNEALGGDPAVNVVKRLEVEYRIEDGATGNGDERGEGGGEGRVERTDVAENQTVAFGGASLPLLRRAFDVGGSPVVRARLYATALGVYELRLNGRRVGNDHLAPGWTDYRKRVHYQTYDVTDLLSSGQNAIAAEVGPGWFNGRAGLFNISRFYGDRPALLVQLEITHADGTTTEVGTDDQWRRHDGPRLSSDMMDGEMYDARRAIDGWMDAAFDDTAWEAVEIRDETRTLEATPDHPVRALADLAPIAITEPETGRWTFDLGQNMVGVVRLAVRAPAGTRLTIRHAEMLNSDGTIYTANLRGAPSVDIYICRGTATNGVGSIGAVETWQPAFTFHGFRYVEITGLPEGMTPSLNDKTSMVTGVVLGSDLPPRGTFESSDEPLNQLQSNIVWGLRGNYLSIPTDCPQRDERMGWTADTQVFAPTALFNADAAPFLSKWLVDLADAQRDDGAFPDVAPNTRGLTFGVPGWADAGTVVPWTIYEMEGDRRVLERHIAGMMKFVDWCEAHSTGLIRDRDRGNDYGDWLSINAATPKDLIGTAYFARSAYLTARSLRVLEREVEATRYQRLYQGVRAAFIERYVDADGRVGNGTQTCYLLALHFGLVPYELRERAAAHLVAGIRERGTRLSTGFLGVGLLLPVLSATGHDDVAADLIMQDKFPSWLFSVKHGATTIWERWDGWTPETGPHPDDSMNSFNHYSLGACGQWLFEGIAGIRPDPAHAGFGHVTIRPVLVEGLTWAGGSVDSVRGRFATRWSLADGVVTLRVTVPANATATVHVPTSDAGAVRESGVAVQDVDGVLGVERGEGVCVVRVGSGVYEFVAPAP